MPNKLRFTADGNVIPVENLNDLPQTLGKNSGKATDWFKNNHMAANRQISSNLFSSQLKLQAGRHST